MPSCTAARSRRKARAKVSAYPDRRFLIIAVTGWGQQADRERARAAGFDLHLAKPVELADRERVMQLEAAAVVAER